MQENDVMLTWSRVAELLLEERVLERRVLEMLPWKDPWTMRRTDVGDRRVVVLETWRYCWIFSCSALIPHHGLAFGFPQSSFHIIMGKRALHAASYGCLDTDLSATTWLGRTEASTVVYI